MTENTYTPDQKKTLQIYAALAASLVFMLVPHMVISAFGLVLFLCVFIAAYIVRKGEDDNNLCDNHMTFIIRSVWISSFFLAIGTVILTFALITQTDIRLMDACAMNLAEQLYAGAAITNDLVLQIYEPCFSQYVALYGQKIILAALITLGPGSVYMIYRTIKGLARAVKGYRIADPKGWF